MELASLWDFIPLVFLPLFTNAKSYFSSLEEVPSLVFYLISSCAKRWLPKINFFHLFLGLAKLGHLGHHFVGELALQNVRSPSLSCIGVSSRPPPNLRPFQQWSREKIQSLYLRSNFTIASPRLVDYWINSTTLREYFFFGPLPTLSRLRTSLVAKLLHPDLDWVHLVSCGLVPLKRKFFKNHRGYQFQKGF